MEDIAPRLLAITGVPDAKFQSGSAAFLHTKWREILKLSIGQLFL
jgi:hypothetical protein